MDAIRLDRVWNIDQIFVNHWDKGRVVFDGKIAEDLIEGLDVVASIIRRQRDAGKEHLDVGIFERREDRVEVAAGLVRWQAAKAIVAAEFDDDDGRVELNNGAEVCSGVLGGGSTGA